MKQCACEILKVTQDDLDSCMGLHEFGPDNRSGIKDTLHRVSCLRERHNNAAGLTFRVGRAVPGLASVFEELMIGEWCS